MIITLTWRFKAKLSTGIISEISRKCCSAPGLFPPPPLLAQAHLFGELRACRGVVRGNHRIVDRQAPFLAILLGRHVVLSAQMALERLELLTVLETNNVIRCDRLFDRDGGLERLG